MEIKENKNASQTTFSVMTSGPKGLQIPILASSLVMEMTTLIMPQSNSTPDYTRFEESLDEMKACGFDGFFARINNFYKNLILEGILKRVQSRGMFVIITSDTFEAPSTNKINELNKNAERFSELVDKIGVYTGFYDNWFKEFINICNKYPSAFGGIYLKDEPYLSEMQQKYPSGKNGPTIEDFNSRAGSYYSLSNRYNLVNSMIGSNAVIIINLIGYPNPEFFVGGTYESYLNAFANIIGRSGERPYLWSYDIYPIKERNWLLEMNFAIATRKPNQDNVSPPFSKEGNGRVTVDYEYFYEDLVLFNRYASQRGSVFWTYIESMEFMTGLQLHPFAREPYLRFAVFTSLAMGCQGIMYWTYHQRENKPTELYLSAPIDRDDNRTPAWYYAKKINAEIRKYNSVFRGATLRDYGHVGQIYSGCRLLTLPLDRLAYISASGSGVLVTRISNATMEYVVIVSHDVNDYQDITVSFNPGNTITEITATNSKENPTPADVNNQSVVRILAPGGYLIFGYRV